MSQSKKVKVRFKNGSVMDLRLDYISAFMGDGRYDIVKTDCLSHPKLGEIGCDDIFEELSKFFSNTNDGVDSVEQRFGHKKCLGYFPRLFFFISKSLYGSGMYLLFRIQNFH
ncbi:MAG: hypothetical protein V3575_00595 [Candidatus Absconditabacteria bacterium]